MARNLVPQRLRDRFRFADHLHARSILAGDFPNEWNDILDCLDQFVLKKSAIIVGGGGRSSIPGDIDGFLSSRGWLEKRFDVKIVVDGMERPTPTHKIDNVKNGIGLEVEWNNKTEFYDRDLNNFRLLHQLGILAVGVIITRQSELQELLFNPLLIGSKYGNSTTHWDKLIPKINGGGAGGCPLFLVGLGMDCYDSNQ